MSSTSSFSTSASSRLLAAFALLSAMSGNLSTGNAVLLGKKTLSPATVRRNYPYSQGNSRSHPLSDAEIRERAQKLIENQHRDDEAIEQYERIERHVERTSGGATSRILEDRTYRVVPTGAGTFKLLLKDSNKPPDLAAYRQQLQALKELLELMLKPDDPRTKTAQAKWQKKKTDRSELVDVTRDAFTAQWAGQETRDGRVCDILELTPNPNFHPRTVFQSAMAHVTVKVWVDYEANQLSRAEAHVMRDVSFGGGFLGKLYRGGVFSFEQAEIAPGIWLPARYQYDFTARKFLFTSEQHQYIEISRYRRDGPPKKVLALMKEEIASGKGVNGDP